MLNTHIKFVDEVTLFRIWSFNKKINKDTVLINYAEQKIDRLFKSDNKDLTKFITGIREKAILSIVEYLIFASAFLMIAFIISLIWILFRNLFSFSIKTINDWLIAGAELVEEKAFKDDNIEGLSYYSSRAPATAKAC